MNIKEADIFTASNTHFTMIIYYIKINTKEQKVIKTKKKNIYIHMYQGSE